MGGGGGGSGAPTATPVADISTSPPKFSFGAAPTLPALPPPSAGYGVPPDTGAGAGFGGMGNFQTSPIMRLISAMGGGNFGGGLAPPGGTSGTAPLVPNQPAGLPYLHYTPQYQFSRAPIIPNSPPTAGAGAGAGDESEASGGSFYDVDRYQQALQQYNANKANLGPMVKPPQKSDFPKNQKPYQDYNNVGA